MQLDELKRRTRITQDVCACVGATILLLVTLGTAVAESKRVLMLHSFGRDFKPWSEYARTIRAELDRQSPWPLEITEHSLMSARSSDENPEAPFVEYLRALHADVAIAGLVCVLILLIDLRGAIGFSSFGVLLYYLIANVAAYTQSPDRRQFPRVLQIIGVGGCGILVLTLPLNAVIGGTLIFVVGMIYRVIRLRVKQSPPS